MAYILSGTTIRAPHQITETNSTQFAQHRTLDGTVSRDFFGSNKRVWVLNYRNTKKSDYDTIYNIYATYLAGNNTKNWRITETNYTVSQTRVHIDLKERGFSVRGSSYISDFDLILTEA